MDVSIGHLRLVGHVVGATDPAGVVDLLTGTSARQRMHEALTAAFDSDEVLVIRTLACTTTLRPDARTAPDALAGSITSSVAQLLREHTADDDCVVRFPDEAAYVAAYVHDCLDGHHDRWYYQTFEPYRRRDGSTDWGALLAAHRARRWRILARVRRHGDLDTLIGVLGDDAAEELAGVDADGDDGWMPLVTTAAEMIGRAMGTATKPVDPGTTRYLTDTEPPPDWRDAASLGSAVAAATAAILSTPGQVVPGRDDVDAALLAEARRHEWFDQAAFADGLAARRAHDVLTDRGGPTAVEPAPSARARQILADLAEVVVDPRLFLDSARPTSGANLVRLVAALVEAAPQWDDDELARSVAAHVLRRWASGPVVRAPREPTPESGRGLAAPIATRPHTKVAGYVRPRPAGRDDATGPATPPSFEPASPQVVADLIGSRFARRDRLGHPQSSQTASGLLLLRGLLDLGLSPYLLDTVGADDEVLAGALLRRWSGAVSPDRDPLLELVAQVAAEAPGRHHRLDDACNLAVRRLLGQGLVTEPLGAVTVPHGSEALATVPVDGSSRLLPLGTLAGRAHLDELLAAVGLTVQAAGANDVRTSVADALSSLHMSGEDELMLDLLAASCVQAWARWLPGFRAASVPFLLTTVVRRPASVDVSPGEVVVVLPPRSHDVVLRLAGYLEPVDAGPVLGGRRLRFLTGGQDGA